MNTTKTVGAVLALLALSLAGSAPASDCHLGRFYPPSYYPAATYYTPLTYSLSGVGDGSNPLAEKIFSEFVKAKEGELAALKREAAMLKAIIDSGAALPPELKALVAPKAEHRGIVLGREVCASCHSAEDKAASGKGHVFYKGGLPADGVDLGKLRDAVEDGSMPPKKYGWGDKERLAFLSGLTRIPPPAAAKAPPKGE